MTGQHVKTRKARKARGRALGLAICAAGVVVWIAPVTASGPLSAWTVVEVVVGMVLVVLGLLIEEMARSMPVAPPPQSTVWIGPEGLQRVRLLAIKDDLDAMGRMIEPLTR